MNPRVIFPIYVEKFVCEMVFIAENGRFYTILELKIIYAKKYHMRWLETHQTGI